MSFSDADTARELFKRAKEFDETIKTQIRQNDQFNVVLFERGVRKGRYNLNSMFSMPLLFWSKASELPLIHASNGRLSMKDVCCFGQSVEQNPCFAVDMLSSDALQYAANQIVEATEKIQQAHIAVFGVNFCRITDGSDEEVIHEIAELHEHIRINNRPNPDIFTMDALIFPLFANGDSGCIIILNPFSLLERSEGPERKETMLIEIGTKEDMNTDARRNIKFVLDSQRTVHDRGPFRGEEITYDDIKEVVIPRANGGHFEIQLQFLYMFMKILENHEDILGYLEGPMEELMMADRETLLEMKEVRMRILRSVAHDVHQTGSELQRYLYERRVQELGLQERERQKKLRENMSPMQVRGESFVCSPPIYQYL